MKPSKTKRTRVEVQLATNDVELPTGTAFTAWVEATLAAGGCDSVDREITVRLVDDTESAHLNQEFRRKSGPTNVLAFPGPDTAGLPGGEPQPFGDVVVCLPLVHREALRQGVDALDHLAHLVVHGTLHLCGYTHDRDADARRMEQLETRIMTGLGFPDPYGAEAPPVQHG